MSENRIQQNYQGMVGVARNEAGGAEAKSETQRQLQQMAPGEQWAHAAAARSNRVGGNEGHFTLTSGVESAVLDNGEMPSGITRKYEVTDRNLDFEGEEGYPTPS